VKGLLTTGLQSSPPRFRVSRRVCPRCVGLHGFRVSCRVAPLCGTPPIHSQTSSNLRIGTLAGALDNRNDSQEPVASSDFSQASATRLLTFLDSDLQTPDGSPQVAVGLTMENTVTPTTLRHLALSLDDLEPPEEATADSELWDIEQEQGVSSDACS